jgi:hypothetical protein
MSADAKAEEYMAQGQKALKKTSFFSFSSGTQKFEDASDCFEKAGNQFKIAKKCENKKQNRIPFSYIKSIHLTLSNIGQEAADAYAKCADCQVKFLSYG